MKKLLVSCIVFFGLINISVAEDENVIIQKVNTNNASIQSYVADLEVIVRKRNVAITSTGKSFYEKPRNYRLQTTNVRTQQQGSDIGSNNDLFWFWIRKIDPNILHFSKYENLYNTNLPNSLHPLWMMDLLGVNTIDTKKASSHKDSNGRVVVQQLTVNPQRQEVYKITIIDPKRPAIVGLGLYSKDGNVLAMCEIQSFFKTNSGAYLPQQSTTQWYTEQQISIETIASNPKVNVRIDPKVFQMPQYSGIRTVDIARQRVDFKERN